MSHLPPLEERRRKRNPPSASTSASIGLASGFYSLTELHSTEEEDDPKYKNLQYYNGEPLPPVEFVVTKDEMPPYNALSDPNLLPYWSRQAELLQLRKEQQAEAKRRERLEEQRRQQQIHQLHLRQRRERRAARQREIQRRKEEEEMERERKRQLQAQQRRLAEEKKEKQRIRRQQEREDERLRREEFERRRREEEDAQNDEEDLGEDYGDEQPGYNARRCESTHRHHHRRHHRRYHGRHAENRGEDEQAFVAEEDGREDPERDADKAYEEGAYAEEGQEVDDDESSANCKGIQTEPFDGSFDDEEFQEEDLQEDGEATADVTGEDRLRGVEQGKAHDPSSLEAIEEGREGEGDAASGSALRPLSDEDSEMLRAREAQQGSALETIDEGEADERYESTPSAHGGRPTQPSSLQPLDNEEAVQPGEEVEQPGESAPAETIVASEETEKKAPSPLGASHLSTPTPDREISMDEVQRAAAEALVARDKALEDAQAAADMRAKAEAAYEEALLSAREAREAAKILRAASASASINMSQNLSKCEGTDSLSGIHQSTPSQEENVSPVEGQSHDEPVEPDTLTQPPPPDDALGARDVTPLEEEDNVEETAHLQDETQDSTHLHESSQLHESSSRSISNLRKSISKISDDGDKKGCGC